MIKIGDVVRVKGSGMKGKVTGNINTRGEVLVAFKDSCCYIPVWQLTHLTEVKTNETDS